MGIVKKVKELFTGKPTKPAAKTDPNLRRLSEIAKRQGDRLKLKPAPKSGPKRGK
jgi:hypothetical protein